MTNLDDLIDEARPNVDAKYETLAGVLYANCCQTLRNCGHDQLIINADERWPDDLLPNEREMWIQLARCAAAVHRELGKAREAGATGAMEDRPGDAIPTP